MNWANNQHQTEQKHETRCREFHGVNGYMPLANDLKYDGMTCDCGKFKFIAEDCTCQRDGKVLKTYPNT